MAPTTRKPVHQPRPLTAAERRALVEAPFPSSFSVITPKSWGGITTTQENIPVTGRRTWVYTPEDPDEQW